MLLFLAFLLLNSTIIYAQYTPPVVTITAPTEVLIGEEFTFQVEFEAMNTDHLYGPFIDIVVDAGGANKTKWPSSTCDPDGIRFLNAQVVAVNGGPLPLPALQTTPPTDNICPPQPGVDHLISSIAVPSNTFPTVNLPSGGQLISLELPYGSYHSGQPTIVIEVTVLCSEKADIGVPLEIRARGGYRYGLDALDNPDLDDPTLYFSDSPFWDIAEVLPSVVRISKSFLGPEDECATGPCMQKYYPTQYVISIEVADGTTINNASLNDMLPDNLEFIDFIDILPAPTSVMPPASGPNASFSVFWDQLSGDATITYDFVVPEYDKNNDLVLGDGCLPALVENDILLEYDYDPSLIDPCDVAGSFTSDATPADHVLTAKSLAIQKSGKFPAPAGGLVPGTVVTFYLDFQISDFKTFRDLRIVDCLPDGQRITNDPPRLTVTDQFGSDIVDAEFILGQDYVVTDDPNQSCPCVCSYAKGGQNIVFDISEKMINENPPHPRHAAGVLTGGLAANNVPCVQATGRVSFTVEVLDAYQYPQTGSQFLVKDDPVSNCVTISGTSLQNDPHPNSIPPADGCKAEDDSKITTVIMADLPTKSIYAVIRGQNEIWGPNTTTAGIPHVTVNDEVIFRIEKELPSTDAENLTVKDWLPLPIFSIDNSSYVWSFDPSAPHCGFPGPGEACIGPTDNLTNWLVQNGFPSPALSHDIIENSLFFKYYSPNDPGNNPRKMDLLFTVLATNDPCADGLHLTNQGIESETNTFGTPFNQVAVAQVQVAQPDVRISKGIVACDNDNAILPIYIPGIQFDDPGSTTCPRYSTDITSDVLSSMQSNSSITGVDANDVVTFAIIIENTGTGPYGAYDISFKDTWPLSVTGDPSCFTPDLSTLCVSYGDLGGLPFDQGVGYNITTSPGSFQIDFVDNNMSPFGKLYPYSPTSGRNIILITYDAVVRDDVALGCCDNTVELLSYSNVEGGQNFVSAGFGGPFEDVASICVEPQGLKSILTTSEVHTAQSGGTEELAIGEIIRYRLQIQVPQTSLSTAYIIRDFLPNGLKYLDDNTFSYNLPVGVSLGSNPLQPTFGSGCGDDVEFDFGAVTNSNTGSGPEIVEIEFNALVCNDLINQNGHELNNIFRIDASGLQFYSNLVKARVVEPEFNIIKTIFPAGSITQGQQATYTVEITNTSSTKAFDVEFTDLVPAPLLVNPNITTTSTGMTAPTVSGTPTFQVAEFPAGAQVTLDYEVHAFTPLSPCPITLTNEAAVEWTSLPGVQGTGAYTPGLSGDPDGERNGIDGPGASHLNNYKAIASAPLTVECSPCAIPPPGMVAWWPLDEPWDSQTIDDIAGTYHDVGIPKPGPATGGSPNPTPISLGMVGSAYSFDQTAYFEIDQPSVELDFGDGDFSIDAWIQIKQCSPNSRSLITGKYDFGSPETGYVLYLIRVSNTPTQATCQLELRINGSAYTSNEFTINLQYQGWTHIAVSVSRDNYPSEGQFYFNAQQLGVYGQPPGTPFTPNTGNVNTNNTVNIGNAPMLLHGYTACPIRIDELELFTTALSKQEVNYIFSADTIGKCKYDLMIEKAAIDPPWGSGPASFTITVTNIGNMIIPANTLVEVTDFLPPGLDFVGVNGVGWTTTTTTGLISCQTWIQTGGLAPGQSLEVLTFDVNVVGLGPFENCATVVASLNSMQLNEPMWNNVHCIVIPPNSCYPPPPCMVDWWPFDEVVTTNSEDIAGYNNIGTWVNNPLPVQGIVGGAIQFDGTNYVEVHDNYEVNFGVNDFSIDFWIATISNGNYSGTRTVLDKRSGPESAPTGFTVFLYNGQIGLQLADGASTNYTTTAYIADNLPHFVAISVDRDEPTGIRIYVDGNLEGTFNPIPHSNSLSNSAPLRIAGSSYPSSVYSVPIAAVLDELEFFCCVLQLSDVQGIFLANTSGKCKPLYPVGAQDLPTPEKCTLYQSYPNPFNATANIGFYLPRHERVTLGVYNKLGREIAVLVDDELPAGRHSVVFNAQDLPSDVYFYRMQAGEFQESRKMILVK